VTPVVASSLSNVASNLVLIQYYGMFGAAVATLMSDIIWRALFRAIGIDLPHSASSRARALPPANCADRS
jgi:O-antigen/teichoic acid export membrane protein